MRELFGWKSKLELGLVKFIHLIFEMVIYELVIINVFD
jgi:hypothetical protein